MLWSQELHEKEECDQEVEGACPLPLLCPHLDIGSNARETERVQWRAMMMLRGLD